jgi:serine/threonine-protein kinase
MAAHLAESVVPPRQLFPELPADLEEIILHCLEKEPERRFQGVVAVDEALARCACSGVWSPEQAADWWTSQGEAASS